MKFLDYWLDRITMYRLLLYYLIGLLGVAMLLGAFGRVSYNPIEIALSAGYLTLLCWLANKVFAFILRVPTNPESSLITALILALIITPPPNIHGYVFLSAAAGLAMASKYLLTIRGHNLFNPAAIAVLLTSLGAGESASWWIGSAIFLPYVLIGGVLLARKVQRFEMITSFLAASLLTMAIVTALGGGDVLHGLQKMALSSPLFFFAFVMLTEPATAPTRATKQRWYGALAGALFPPQLHVFTFYSTPELALIISNIFSYCIEQKSRLLPRLLKKEVLGPNIADFVFAPGTRLAYQPGQYMEWTLPHNNPDGRGSRRYFTLASSPTEDTLRIGVKLYPNGSTYKKTLVQLADRTPIAAGQLGGDFVLPRDPGQKLVFIAGGIGITPFRSMLKYLLDTGEVRDITLLYAARSDKELVYRNVVTAAQQQLGTKVGYILGEPITAQTIHANVPDFMDRKFYISGPHPMVTATVAALRSLGVHHSNVKIDFFPGYA